MLRLKLHYTHLWVLIIAFLSFLIPLLLLEYPLLQYSNGIFAYPYDEAYTRMAIAKNLAFHGGWSLSGEEFNSASSSIIYPLVLAGLYKLFGVHLVFPFMINVFAAIVCIVVVQRWLQRQGLAKAAQTAVLAGMILLTPIPALVADGLEHMIQVLFTILFLIQFSEWFAATGEQRNKRLRLPWNIYALGILVTATRYEGLFVVLVACLALLVKRRPLLFLAFGVVSTLPIVFFGIYSLRQGAYFLPTSIMLKAIPVPLDGGAIRKFFTDDIFIRLVYPYNTSGAIATTRLLIALPLLYWLFLRQMKKHTSYLTMLLFCLGLTILHLTFASVVLFFRYEAYLVACSAVIIGLMVGKEGKKLWPQNGAAAGWIAAWTCILLFYPFFSRSWAAYNETFTASLNTYEQAYQEAQFVHQFYNEAVIITDDIGTASYLSEGRKMDLGTGIGYVEIAHSRENSYWRADYANYLIRQEKPALAIIRENRYGSGLLQQWVKVADWYTNNKVVQRDDHLSLYALDSISAPVLKRKLQAFEPLLPSAVKVVYP